MNSKALIITINNMNYNYGNRLQNYAIVRILEKLNIKSRTLCFERNRYIKEILLIKRFIHKLTNYRLSGNKEYWKYLVEKDIKFNDFDRKYIRMHYTSRLYKVPKKFDYYLVGSDQVWNPLWFNDKRKEYYLLSFAEPEKGIAFCASFGIDYIPSEWENWFRDNLSNFRALSVREESGAGIIKELTGRTAEVLIDPTMLLTDKEWESIAKKPKGLCDEPYVLTYFLSPPCDAAKELKKELSSSIRVHSLCDYNDEVCRTAGLEEFIYLFSKASLILTDSFHACVFSFLFNKPFIVFDREIEISMNSRLETFLNKFGLERKYYGSDMENDIWEHDYLTAYDRLDKERERAIKFLRNSFNGNE